MGIAAHKAKIEISTDDVTYVEIDGVNSVSFGPSRDTLETTDFADTSGARKKIKGLVDGVISTSGHYKATGAQKTIRNTHDDGAEDDTLFVRILWNGVAGHKVRCVVASYSLDGELDGTVQCSYEFEFAGKPTEVTV